MRAGEAPADWKVKADPESEGMVQRVSNGASFKRDARGYVAKR